MKNKNLNTIDWELFHSIRDFDNVRFWKTSSAAKPWIGKSKVSTNYPSGIYLYGFIDNINGENLFAPYYVGKSGNIFDRLYNHIAGLRGCSLAIFKRTEIFSKDKDFNKNKPLNYGSLSFFKNFLNEEQNKLGKEILEEINWMMEHFVVTWTIENDAKKRGKLEKEIGKIFDTKYLITKIGSPNDGINKPDQIEIENLEINSQKIISEWKIVTYNKTLEKIMSKEIVGQQPFYKIEPTDCHAEAKKILAGNDII